MESKLRDMESTKTESQKLRDENSRLKREVEELRQRQPKAPAPQSNYSYETGKARVP
jgi:regulator of replication initiation timing